MPSEDPSSTFNDLALTPEVKSALDAMGWFVPTPVQTKTYTPATSGRDLVVQAQTGTGKTGAFGIPLVDRLVVPTRGAQALILAPTRELALQSAREVTKLGVNRGIEAVAVYGGAPIQKQVTALEQGAQIVSGTPGRVLDHLKRGTLKGEAIQFLVLDEADEMLSMGFARELNAIMGKLSQKRQTMLFSATLSQEVQRMAERHMHDPKFIRLSSDAVGASNISHFVYLVSGTGRARDLVKIIETEDPESAIIFCNTKVETQQAASALQAAGYNADWLNGDLAQSEREKLMARTRKGTLRFLVATDVAARGIDVSHLTHVINHQFPPDAAQYIHRTGRTGRAGRTGTALSLVSPQDLGALYYLRLLYKIFPVERSLPSDVEDRTRAEVDRIGLLQAASAGIKPNEMDYATARRLLTHHQAETILARMLAQFFGAHADPDEDAAIARRERAPEPVAETEPASDAPRPARKRRRRSSRTGRTTEDAEPAKPASADKV